EQPGRAADVFPDSCQSCGFEAIIFGVDYRAINCDSARSSLSFALWQVADVNNLAEQPMFFRIPARVVD
ncbi:MAG: hypothetical protein WEA56_00215, partial [Balneolaceae bacterium]